MASSRIMCGCDDPEVFDAAKEVIDAYAKSCVCLGPAGAGQLTKMVNQICIAGLVQGLAEGVNFAQRAGLDVDQVIDVIGKGAAQSWQMDNRARTMAESSFDFGFAVEWMRKDLGICLEEAERNGARLPVRRSSTSSTSRSSPAVATAGTPAASSTCSNTPEPVARVRHNATGCSTPRPVALCLTPATGQRTARCICSTPRIVRRSRNVGSSSSSIESNRRIRRPIATDASSRASEAPRQ